MSQDAIARSDLIELEGRLRLEIIRTKNEVMRWTLILLASGATLAEAFIFYVLLQHSH